MKRLAPLSPLAPIAIGRPTPLPALDKARLQTHESARSLHAAESQSHSAALPSIGAGVYTRAHTYGEKSLEEYKDSSTGPVRLGEALALAATLPAQLYEACIGEQQVTSSRCHSDRYSPCPLTLSVSCDAQHVADATATAAAVNCSVSPRLPPSGRLQPLMFDTATATAPAQLESQSQSKPHLPPIHFGALSVSPKHANALAIPVKVPAEPAPTFALIERGAPAAVMDIGAEEEEKCIVAEERELVEKLTARGGGMSNKHSDTDIDRAQLPESSASEASQSESDDDDDDDAEVRDVSERSRSQRPAAMVLPPVSPALATAVAASVASPLPTVAPLPQPQSFVRSISADSHSLSVFVGTWNLHGKPAPDDSVLSAWLPSNSADIYVIGTEECDMSIERAVLYSPMSSGKKEKWCRRLLTMINANADVSDRYVLVAEEGMVAMHIAVVCRQSIQSQLTSVQRARVATGVGNVIGNKGGVAVSFHVGVTSFLAINAHFAAHHHNVEQRNLDYALINAKLALRLSNQTVQVQPSSTAMLSAVDAFDRVFWLGDLNYRIDGSYALVNHLIHSGLHEVLINNDQLRQQRLRKKVFHGFYEHPITFQPTYKIDTASLTSLTAPTDRANPVVYDRSKKRRVPGFTDRILWKDLCSGSSIHCHRYDSVEAIRTSDHFPVFATFDVRVEGWKHSADNTTTDDTAASSPDGSEDAVATAAPAVAVDGNSESSPPASTAVTAALATEVDSKVCVVQ